MNNDYKFEITEVDTCGEGDVSGDFSDFKVDDRLKITQNGVVSLVRVTRASKYGIEVAPFKGKGKAEWKRKTIGRLK